MLKIRRSKPLSELDRGEVFEAQDTLSAAQVARFSVMFGLDGKVVPALAAGALISHVITTRFPGPGSRIIAETLRYGGGMAEGDVLTTGLVVLDIDKQAGVARLACRVTGPGGMVLADGEVEMLPPTTAEERALPRPAACADRRCAPLRCGKPARGHPGHEAGADYADPDGARGADTRHCG